MTKYLLRPLWTSWTVFFLPTVFVLFDSRVDHSTLRAWAATSEAPNLVLYPAKRHFSVDSAWKRLRISNPPLQPRFPSSGWRSLGWAFLCYQGCYFSRPWTVWAQCYVGKLAKETLFIFIFLNQSIDQSITRFFVEAIPSVLRLAAGLSSSLEKWSSENFRASLWPIILFSIRAGGRRKGDAAREDDWEFALPWDKSKELLRLLPRLLHSMIALTADKHTIFQNWSLFSDVPGKIMARKHQLGSSIARTGSKCNAQCALHRKFHFLAKI